jgi:DNA-directed RNA polymerase specialized sigma24 family protein
MFFTWWVKFLTRRHFSGKEGSMNMSGTVTLTEYASAYNCGYRQTTNFLIFRGLPEDEAAEKAQAAWAKGWERRGQIRDKSKTLTWINTIALNLYRSQARRDAKRCEFTDYAVPPKASPTAVDIHRILQRCRPQDSRLLREHYLIGYGIRDLARNYRCSETAVRVRLLRARRRMLEWFDAARAHRGNGLRDVK